MHYFLTRASLIVIGLILCVYYLIVCLSVSMQLTAWKDCEMTCYVSSGILNSTHSLIKRNIVEFCHFQYCIVILSCIDIVGLHLVFDSLGRLDFIRV